MIVDNKPCHLIFDGDFSEVSKYIPKAKRMLEELYASNLPAMYEELDSVTSIRVINITNQLGKIYIKAGGCKSRFVGHQDGSEDVVIVATSGDTSSLLKSADYATTYAPLPLQYYSGEWNEYYPNKANKINISIFQNVYYQNKWLFKQNVAVSDIGFVIGAALTKAEDLFLATMKLDYIGGQTVGKFRLCFVTSPLSPAATLPLSLITDYIEVPAETLIALAGVSPTERYSMFDLSYAGFSKDLDKISFFMVTTTGTNAILVEITNITKYQSEGLLFNCTPTNHKRFAIALGEAGADIGQNYSLTPVEWLISHGYDDKGIATKVYWDQIQWDQTFSGNNPFNIGFPINTGNQTANYTTAFRGKFKIGAVDLTPESVLTSSTSAAINGNTPHASGSESKTVNRDWWFLDVMDTRQGIFMLRHSQETSNTNISYSGDTRRTIVSGTRIEDYYIACIKNDGTINKVKVDTVTTDLSSDTSLVLIDGRFIIVTRPELELVSHYISPRTAASPCGWVYYKGKLYAKPSKNNDKFKIIDISTKYGLSKFVGKDGKEPPALI